MNAERKLGTVVGMVAARLCPAGQGNPRACHRPKARLSSIRVRRAWPSFRSDTVLNDAILDHVLHTAHRIEAKGDSLRRKVSCRVA